MPNSKSRTCADSRRGFTLSGLVLGLASAGLLVMLFIPLYQNAKNTATLRATIAVMEMWDKAIKAYESDFGVTPTNPNGRIHYKKPILRELMPYFERVRVADLWGTPYRIWIGPGIKKYGIKTTGPGDILIVSLGKEGNQENWSYDPERPQAGLYSLRGSEDFEKDIVLWNGRMVRGPINP
ncbi:MAG: hypothetical protein NTU60_02310 [Candidatus Aminicenantes bacterium]|nr:hypothetical protein [Candidatus Aminicenantes bacterium]